MISSGQPVHKQPIPPLPEGLMVVHGGGYIYRPAVFFPFQLSLFPSISFSIHLKWPSPLASFQFLSAILFCFLPLCSLPVIRCSMAHCHTDREREKERDKPFYVKHLGWKFCLSFNSVLATYSMSSPSFYHQHQRTTRENDQNAQLLLFIILHHVGDPLFLSVSVFLTQQCRVLEQIKGSSSS